MHAGFQRADLLDNLPLALDLTFHALDLVLEILVFKLEIRDLCLILAELRGFLLGPWSIVAS